MQEFWRFYAFWPSDEGNKICVVRFLLFTLSLELPIIRVVWIKYVANFMVDNNFQFKTCSWTVLVINIVVAIEVVVDMDRAVQCMVFNVLLNADVSSYKSNCKLQNKHSKTSTSKRICGFVETFQLKSMF